MSSNSYLLQFAGVGVVFKGEGCPSGVFWNSASLLSISSSASSHFGILASG